MNTTARISIGAVVRKTGLSAHLLRAWERRYKVVNPERTSGGLRVYSHADVLRLQLLKKLTEQGHPIGQIASLSERDLAALLNNDAIENAVRAVQTEQTEAGRFMAEVLEAVQSLDGPRIYSTLMRAVVALTSKEFARDLVIPLLARVGAMWANESICPVHEHILSVNLRRVLAWVIDSLPVDQNAPVIACTTPSQQRHELGAMLAGIAATEEGWRVAYLGPDLPAEDIAIGAKVTGASVVAVSMVYVRAPYQAKTEIEKIRKALPDGVMLVVGGAGANKAKLEKTGAIVLSSFNELLSLLRTRDHRRRA